MKKNRIGFISLGCAKALVDSERIMTQLNQEGYELVPSYHEADLVIINTCGFINEAIAESMEMIGEALAENGKVVVTGCLGTKKELILEKYPNVLAVTGPADYESVMKIVHEQLPRPHDPFIDLFPIKLTPKHYAYLKISEGCHNRCSFCIIPKLRGTLKSRPMNDIIQEATQLAQHGVKELLIIAQDTLAYGRDLKDPQANIKNLIHELSKLNIWIRLHYLYPYPALDELIPYMAEKKVLPYLDVPLQHASPTILKKMKRPADAENVLKRIEKWRALCPDITIRSTFIVGFPGETDEDFELLLDFLEAAQLDRVGCFKYSPVEGADANALPDPVDEETKEERLERLMLLQTNISTEKLKQKIGKTVSVIIDEIDHDQIIGRSMSDSPEVDGTVFVTTTQTVKPGDIIQVIITDSSEHDLFGKQK